MFPLLYLLTNVASGYLGELLQASGVGKKEGLDHSWFFVSLFLLQTGESDVHSAEKKSSCAHTHLISTLD